MDSRCISLGMKTGLAESWGNVNGSQGPREGDDALAADVDGGGRTGKRAEARRGACVRRCVDADWIASKYLGWVALLLLPAKQTSPNGPVNRSIG